MGYIFFCVLGCLVISYFMRKIVNFMILSAGFCCIPLKLVFLSWKIIKLLVGYVYFFRVFF